MVIKRNRRLNNLPGVLSNLKCLEFSCVIFHSDFEAVLKLEPGNKQAINELTKIRNVCIPMSFFYKPGISAFILYYVNFNIILPDFFNLIFVDYLMWVLFVFFQELAEKEQSCHEEYPAVLIKESEIKNIVKLTHNPLNLKSTVSLVFFGVCFLLLLWIAVCNDGKSRVEVKNTVFAFLCLLIGYVVRRDSLKFKYLLLLIYFQICNFYVSVCVQ